jgi:SpoVK/Ycf46/Vps4 family AAA+-type ATPase
MELSKEIAAFLGWPALAIDPSHLLRSGMDGMQAEANTIFRMLEETERVVVLFDEFDELVRERGSSNAQPFSRLLTTAMLPKLANIHKRATLVFIIATNSISEFDLAIRRPGRFDRVLQIMPPSYAAKMARKDWGAQHDIDFAARFKDLAVDVTDDIKSELEALTFGECETFAADLAGAISAQAVATALSAIWKGCTLQTRVRSEEATTWGQQCKDDAELNR